MLTLLSTPIQAEEDVISQLIPFIIHCESNGNSNAVSSAGCIGLMQINPRGALAEWNDFETNAEKIYHEQRKKGIYPPVHPNGGWIMGDFKYYKTIDLFKPEVNLEIGTWYLSRLKDHYLKENYTIEGMLAAYNGGITRLRKHNYDVRKMPAETRAYVKKIMRLYNQARGE